MRQFIDKLKNFKRWEWAFLLIIIAGGIFLRTYNFSDWVRFNDDQVRDASIVDKMVSGEEFPLLGPKAGGTSFNLGSAFYYLEYFSALLFGNTSQSLAYPVLFFSILSIPLFYFLFKNIFIRNIALTLTAIYAGSFFIIKYSRFAWNMNLVPFFVLAFIFLLAKIADENDKNKNLWAIFLGITIGIGIQLHTLLLICFPLVLLLFLLIDFLKNKKIALRKILVVIFIALILNFPSILYDIKTNGENMGSFFKGATSKTKEKISIWEKISKNSSCQIQGNSFVLSAYGNNDECNIFQKDQESNFWLRKLNIWGSCAFFIGGLMLVLFFGLKKKYFSENKFFSVMILYFLVSSVVFIPLSGEVSLRMFTVIVFVPFLFLGLWMNFIKDKMGKAGIGLSVIFTILLLGANIFVFRNTYFALGDMYRDDKYFGGASLGELKKISSYIEESVENNGKVQIFSFTNARSLEYLLEKSGLDTEIKSDDEAELGNIYFLLKKNDFRLNNKKEKSLQKDLEKFNELDSEIIGQYTVFKLEFLK